MEAAVASRAPAGRLHLVESALTAAACILAIACPVELLVLSFTVLGPIHYLTEIAWLEERRFFLPRRRDAALLAALALAASAPALGLGPHLARVVPPSAAADGVEVATVALVFVAVGGALWLRVVRGAVLRLAGLVVLAAVSVAVSSTRASYAWFVLWAVMLPTLVHVFLFTAAFVLHGALRERSGNGLLSFGSLLAGAGVILAVGAAAPPFSGGGVFLAGYASLFVPVYRHVEAFLPGSSTAADGAGGALLFARFAAFAYTTHYLNWFTKTSVIGWHRVRPARLAVAGALATASLGLCAVDSGAGLALLSVLSLLHVLLELPLDWRCLGGIGHELSRVAGPSGWRKA